MKIVVRDVLDVQVDVKVVVDVVLDVGQLV